MANNSLGKIRRSSVVMMFGPGAIVDFRSDGAPVSAMAAGLEEWDRAFPPAGLRNDQIIHEPRLERKLAIKGFRLPPITSEIKGDQSEASKALPAVRFPEWLQCPNCDRIAPAGQWNSDPGRAFRYCGKCTSSSPGQRKVYAVPVRFIMACRKGHVDEFPWDQWVGHKQACSKSGRSLYLKSEKPGLAGLILSCKECGASRSLDGIFSEDTWLKHKCRGRRPWLAGSDEQCGQHPRALQRGASNIYFPIIESSLSIPPWSDSLQEALGFYWSDIVNTEPLERAQFISILARNALKPVLDELQLTAQELAKQIEERLRLFSDDTILDIKKEEYRRLTARSDSPKRGDEFEIRNVQIPANLRSLLSHIVRVVRLREIRALKGFTRIDPPEDMEDTAPLSVKKLEWLPAIEVRGEGIFIALNQSSLKTWLLEPEVGRRAGIVNAQWSIEWKSRHGAGSNPPIQITPTHLLVHSLAHAMMRQLSLECGYSAASLRERLYINDDADGMAGALIYTASSDSDGTLGGLQRQGISQRIGEILPAAIKSLAWCSSDPLCITGAMSEGTPSLSACHACMLAPETSCEEYNKFLDRAMLVGLPENPDVGYLKSLL